MGFKANMRRTFFAGGIAPASGTFGGWTPVDPAGFPLPAVGAGVPIQPSLSPIRGYQEDVKSRGYLLNAHAVRFKVTMAFNYPGAGVDARCTEAQLGCCWALERFKHPSMNQAFTDQQYTFSQLRFEVANIIGGPRFSEHLRYTDPRSTEGFPEEFAGTVAGVVGYLFAKGAYPGARGELSRDYKVSWSQTSLNTFPINRAVAGAANVAVTLEVTIPLTSNSGNPDADVLPLEMFTDVNAPAVFTITHVLDELATLFPAGSARTLGRLDVDFYCTATKIGDARPVGVPWSAITRTIGNQNNFQLPTLPYVAVIHSALYQPRSVPLADAPMLVIPYEPIDYQGADTAVIELTNQKGERVWPLTSNLQGYGTMRQLLQGWNRVASERARFPMLAEPVNLVNTTGLYAAVPSRWASLASAVPANTRQPYDVTDGRSLLRGWTADALPFLPLAYNDYSAKGFPNGFADYNGRGNLTINVQGYALPPNDPGLTTARALTLAIAPDEVPGAEASDRVTIASYAATGSSGCSLRGLGKVVPVLDNPSTYQSNVAPLVPWVVTTNNYRC